METIKTYLDNVFAVFPQTERVLALKLEMLTGMEEKYHELIADGKSEHEAVGSVIANFGSIDEIVAEMGIAPNAAEPDDGIRLSGEEAFDFLAQTRRSSSFIAIGVWLVLAGVSAMLLIGWLYGADDSIFSAFGVLVLLLTVAGAVPIFIVNAMRLERFEIYELQGVQLDMQTQADIEKQSARYTPRFIARISTGAVFLILAVGALIFARSLGYGFQMIIVLIMTAGFSVFLFIPAGMIKSAYDVLLNKGDYAEIVRFSRFELKKGERIIATVASAYWPLVIAAYLLWSFIGSAWSISWVIWPAAALLFGAIAGGIGAWFATSTKKG